MANRACEAIKPKSDVEKTLSTPVNALLWQMPFIYPAVSKHCTELKASRIFSLPITLLLKEVTSLFTMPQQCQQQELLKNIPQLAGFIRQIVARTCSARKLCGTRTLQSPYTIMCYVQCTLSLNPGCRNCGCRTCSDWLGDHPLQQGATAVKGRCNDIVVRLWQLGLAFTIQVYMIQLLGLLQWSFTIAGMN